MKNLINVGLIQLSYYIKTKRFEIFTISAFLKDAVSYCKPVRSRNWAEINVVSTLIAARVENCFAVYIFRTSILCRLYCWKSSQPPLRAEESINLHICIHTWSWKKNINIKTEIGNKIISHLSQCQMYQIFQRTLFFWIIDLFWKILSHKFFIGNCNPCSCKRNGNNNIPLIKHFIFNEND